MMVLTSKQAGVKKRRAAGGETWWLLVAEGGLRFMVPALVQVRQVRMQLCCDCDSAAVGGAAYLV